MSDFFCDPMDCDLSGPSDHGISQARILGWVAISFSRDLPHPGIETVSPAWQADSLPLSHLGSCKQDVSSGNYLFALCHFSLRKLSLETLLL